jgi:transcriptional regulator with XRE-family HTH domain
MNMETTYELYLKVSEKFSKNEISEKIGVNKNTISRWEILKSVPRNYHFDLLELNGDEINYQLFDEKDKDQFFTKKTN